MPLPQIAIGDSMLGSALLASVEVTQELNQHWWCRIECRQTTDQRIKVEQLLGQTVEVKTTDDQGVTVTHFAGFVLDVELVYEVWGSYGARLTAVSDSYKMDIAAHKQYYADQTLSGIGGIVGGRNGVSVSVNAAGSKALNYVQYGEPDFHFLNRIVDDYGAWLRPKKGGVEVFDSFQTGSNLTFRDVNGLVSFRLRGTMVPPSFSGSHYDHHAMASNTFQQVSKPAQYYDGAQPLTGAVQSASEKLPAGFEPQRARAMTLGNYQDQLQAESERASGGAVTGTGESRNQSLMAGNTVAIEGILDGKGTYGLIRVVHQWTPQGYVNSFTCTPWKNYRNPQPPAARMWNGVVSARVVDHNDPKKMGRIKVQFFWQEDGSTHWARATAPHAGPDRGFMFMPEVGDEVAVAFEDGDPERPVILGSLWNGVQQAPRYDFRGGDIEPNNVKRLVTKSGNRLHLSDKPGQETVFLATPNHTSLSMTEKSDETGRQLVHIHSDGDIVLSAGGRVHIMSEFFSREIGSPGKAEAALATVKASAAASPATPAPAKESFLGGLLGGLYDSTLKPLGHMIAHPIDTVEGIGHAVAHPVDTAHALGHAISTTANGVMSGDGRSIGTAVGSVGMLFVPGADVAEGAEDAARLGQVGELGDASRLGDVAGTTRAVDSAASGGGVSGALGESGTSVATEAGTTTFSGHGGYDLSNGVFTVPEGSSLTVFSEHGASISDPLGNLVETGGDTSGVWQRTYGPGEQMPNYTLHPPDGLNIQGSPTTVTSPTNLDQLVGPNMGSCNWAACTYDPNSTASTLTYGTNGIIDESTGSYITTYTGK